MREKKQVQAFFRVVVVLNLITLAGVFLGPRLAFIWKHRDMTSEQFLRTPGTYDLPNLYWKSFVLAGAIRLATPKNANLFFPEEGAPFFKASAHHNVLLPRRIYFEGTPGFQRFFDAGPLLSRSWWVIPKENQNKCKRGKTESLGDTEYLLCRLDK